MSALFSICTLENGSTREFEFILNDFPRMKKPRITRGLSEVFEGEGAGIRTLDLPIKSRLLYQLSYALNPPFR